MTNVKILYSKFDKKAIPELPKVEFGGRIIVIQTAGEADRAVNYLMQFPQLGIDTETRPNFKPGGMNPVALLQVSTPEACFLFRLNRFGLTDSLVQLFTSEVVEKIGLSLHDDWAQLRKRKDFQPVNYVELQDYVKPFGIKDMSLQKLYANFFGQKISRYFSSAARTNRSAASILGFSPGPSIISRVSLQRATSCVCSPLKVSSLP